MADFSSRYQILIKVFLGLYALICLVIFVWFRFSYDSIKNKAEDALSDMIGAQVTLGHIKPSMLWGFSVESMEIKGIQVARKVVITPRPLEIFRGCLGLGFKADLVSGTSSGHMILPFKTSKRPLDITINMAGVDLAGFSKVFPLNLNPKGTVTGELRLTSPRDAFDKATGSLMLEWKKGTLPLTGMASLPFDALTFETLELNGSVNNGLLSIEKADLVGEFSCTMSGSIRFSKDIKKSRLALTGELNLPEAMKKALGPEYSTPGQGIKFSIRGSIDKPRFSMLNAAARRMPGGTVQNTNVPSSQMQQFNERRQIERERARQEALSPSSIPPMAIDNNNVPEMPMTDEIQGEKALTNPEGP